MYSILTFLIVGTLWTVVNCEKHTHMVIYTAFSNPVNLPGIHEYSVIGLLDDRMIEYYDSSIRKYIPKQPWMKRMEKDYWERQTQILQGNEEVDKVNLGIFRDRMRQSNDTGLHIHQKRYGCTAEKQTGDDKSLKFISGFYENSYDGNDLLVFDHVNKRWIATNDLGVPTKRKWDESMWTDHLKHYLQIECVDWLSKYVDYGQEQLKNSRPPDLHMYGKKSRNPSFITLHCMATGFLFKQVTLSIMRDGKVVDPLDGLQTTGVRPNGDGTYQIMNRVEILRSDPARYRCEVTHPDASNMDKTIEWDRSMQDDNSGPNIGLWLAIAGGVVAGLLLVVGVAVAVKRTRQDSTGTNKAFAQGSSSDGSTPPESISLMEGNVASTAPV